MKKVVFKDIMEYVEDTKNKVLESVPKIIMIQDTSNCFEEKILRVCYLKFRILNITIKMLQGISIVLLFHLVPGISNNNSKCV